MKKQNKKKQKRELKRKLLIVFFSFLALALIYISLSIITGKPIIMWDLGKPMDCTESYDKGLDLYKRGICSDGTGSYNNGGTDYCKSGYVLVEYYCMNNQCANKEYNCNDACISGACMAPSKVLSKQRK